MNKLYIYSIAVAFMMLTACTKQEIIDTGISNGVHKTSMMSYLKTDSYNWDSTIVMIKRANLEPLFEGTDVAHPQITFLGPTNHSIRRYMLQNNINSIRDLSVEFCRDMILMHVLDKRYMRSDINFKNLSYPISDRLNGGGTDLFTLYGNNVRLYNIRTNDSAAPNLGPVYVYIYSFTAQTDVPIASPDIQTNNGVVISLGYNYGLGNI